MLRKRFRMETRRLFVIRLCVNTRINLKAHSIINNRRHVSSSCVVMRLIETHWNLADFLISFIFLHSFRYKHKYTDGEYLFADPESKLSKYGPKSWRSSHTHVSLFVLIHRGILLPCKEITTISIRMKMTHTHSKCSMFLFFVCMCLICSGFGCKRSTIARAPFSCTVLHRKSANATR